jgi:hypothetical protein
VKSFFKSFFASLLAIVVFFGLLFVLFFGIAGALLADEQPILIFLTIAVATTHAVWT